MTTSVQEASHDGTTTIAVMLTGMAILTDVLTDGTDGAHSSTHGTILHGMDGATHGCITVGTAGTTHGITAMVGEVIITRYTWESVVAVTDIPNVTDL